LQNTTGDRAIENWYPTDQRKKELEYNLGYFIIFNKQFLALNTNSN
jgi:hypothetical protein